MALTILLWLTALPAIANVLVFAPSSMVDVMSELAHQHEKRTGQAVSVSFAATSQLARQLDAGAPAEIFITADKEWMDWAIAREVVDETSVQVFAGNTLVIARAAGSPPAAWSAALTGERRFAMAEPESVPAGRYARAALQKAGLWDAARANAVFGENVRVTLGLAARQEVDAAIVYESDARSEKAVTIIHRFTKGDHAPIRYFAGLTPKAGKPAEMFFAALKSADSRKALAGAGFTLPPFAD